MEKVVLNAAEGADFIKKYARIPKYEVVNTYDQVTMKAPLVLKILSKSALHKTEINGVRVVMEQESLKKDFEELLGIAQSNNIPLDGIMVQEFVKGIESIVGIKKDPVFGHMILFGIGGVFAEAIADTSTRKCPITVEDAEEMIEDLRASKVFHGFRGMNVDLEMLKANLVKISQLPKKHPRIGELDINPFILSPQGNLAVDVRVISV